ncbi:MAG: hypothetical protein C4554_00145 [Dethiobacter sp.]|nr:MAG: hypothetical protein C4554_00145 [Dethiobacter sp.]
MAGKPLALLFLGIIFFALVVYCGLNAVENGIQELMALEGPGQALRFKVGEGKLVILFAGKNYLISYGSYLKGLF